MLSSSVLCFFFHCDLHSSIFSSSITITNSGLTFFHEPYFFIKVITIFRLWKPVFLIIYKYVSSQHWNLFSLISVTSLNLISNVNHHKYITLSRTFHIISFCVFFWRRSSSRSFSSTKYIFQKDLHLLLYQPPKGLFGYPYPKVKKILLEQCWIDLLKKNF